MDHQQQKRIDEYAETIDGARRAMVLLALLELKVHAALADGWRTLDDLAEATGTQARRLEPFLDVACAMRFLRRSNGRYGLMAGDEALFAPGTTTDQSLMIGTFEDTFAGLGKAVQVLKSGQNLASPGTGADVPASKRRQFLLYLHHRSITVAEEVAGILCRESFENVIDLGAGAGTYAFALLERMPQARATLVDRENAVPLMVELAEQQGLLARVETSSIDFLQNEFGRDHDLAIVSNIIHCYGEAATRALFARISERLPPGGRVAVKDFYLAPDRTGPDSGLWFRIRMAMNSAEGDVYPEAQVRRWLEEAGLTPEISYALREAPESYLLVARKGAGRT